MTIPAPLRRLAGRSTRHPSRALAVTTVVTAVTTYLLIVVGGVVRTSGSGLGCGTAGGRNDWPFCQGGLLPPLQREAVIEFSHRWLAAAVSTLAIALLVVVWARYRHLRALAWTTTAFTVFLAVQVVLGAVTVYNLLPPAVVSVHLANAELLLGAALLLAVLTRSGGRPPLRVAGSPAVRAAARWAVAAAAATYLLVVSGAVVVSQGAGFACDGWPLCGGGYELDASQAGAYNVAHRVMVAIASVLIVVAVHALVRAHRRFGIVRVAAVAVGLLLVAQVVAGAVLVDSRLAAASRSVHEALASGLWGGVALLAILAWPGMLERLAAPPGATVAPRPGAEVPARVRPQRVGVGS